MKDVYNFNNEEEEYFKEVEEKFDGKSIMFPDKESFDSIDDLVYYAIKHNYISKNNIYVGSYQVLDFPTNSKTVYKNGSKRTQRIGASRSMEDLYMLAKYYFKDSKPRDSFTVFLPNTD